MGLGAARKTSLVTGAAGLIGSHLVDRLLDEGVEVVGIDNLMTGDLANLHAAGKDSHFHFQLGDVREPVLAYAEMVFNCACPASPVHYQSDPWATLTTSVLGAMRLIELARGRRCTIVHCSTSEVYGDPSVTPQPESYWGNVNPVGARACYDEGKRCAETMFNDASRCWNVDARIVRIFNTYGPRMALDDGRVVSNFLVRALRGEPLQLYGGGRQTRSFCYVDDLVEGLLRVSRLPALRGPVNLGHPAAISIADLAHEVIRLVGTDATVVDGPLPADDPQQRMPDITRAQALFGFQPTVPLKEGLRRTLEDFRPRMPNGASRQVLA